MDMVIVGDLWPCSSDTRTLTGVPDATIRDAAVCRLSWSRIRGNAEPPAVLLEPPTPSSDDTAASARRLGRNHHPGRQGQLPAASFS